ncbi:MAG: hypothetical protein D8M59_15235 [Planctomycetes bacterium]|nr:hypothetical protein [Planctomycetota bacterium]NOG52795.1 hypothetical protein [Planctomycetota bacterium]
MAKRIIAHIIVVLALLVFGAHVMRNYGIPVAVSTLVIAAATLVVGNRIAVTVLQLLLLAATVEWLRTALTLVHERQQEGEEFMRMLIILGSVGAFTLLATGMARWCIRETPATSSDGSAPASDQNGHK